jgi:hypothetical protein
MIVSFVVPPRLATLKAENILLGSSVTLEAYRHFHYVAGALFELEIQLDQETNREMYQ